MAAGASDASARLREVINQIIEGRIDANRKYIDQVLEGIMDYHHRYYLEKLAIEVMRAEAEEKAGNVQGAFRHRVMIDTYKGLLEKAFSQSV